MEVCRRSSWLLLLLGVSLLATALQGVQGEAEFEGPSESECRPYIEKALKELETGEPSDIGTKETADSKEDVPTVEVTTDDSDHQDEGVGEDEIHEGHESTESVESDQHVPLEQHSGQEDTPEEFNNDASEAETEADDTDTTKEVETETSIESDQQTEEQNDENKADETKVETISEETDDTHEKVEGRPQESTTETTETEETSDTTEDTGEESQEEAEEEAQQEASEEVKEDSAEGEKTESEDEGSDEGEQKEGTEGDQEKIDEDEQVESAEAHQEESVEGVQTASAEVDQAESAEGEEPEESVETQSRQEENKESEENKDESAESEKTEDEGKSDEGIKTEVTEDNKSETKEDISGESEAGNEKAETTGESDEKSAEQDDNTSNTVEQKESEEGDTEELQQDEGKETPVGESHEKEDSEGKPQDDEGDDEDAKGDDEDAKSDEYSDSAPEEELGLDIEIPTDLRERSHVEHLLKLDDEASETEKIINRVAEITLRELKKLYENAIKPLEVLYKYRDLSNRHFGDSEIFSKPLILFMGPWSGGKSSIINYLLDNEYNETSLKTGAEPSPAYFNILMYGEEPEIIDGTQLAADYTFSGLQKFGQGLEERLRGVKLPSKLLEKVNIVEIPGILEVRKQVSRVFPFNDACQWFIDRADIIFLVYDPSKLDVGPETEAILDQLKGREHQTRIILNKADQVKPEELMRVQGALIWNISPLMSSPQPPIMYTTSLWSRPYESWAPIRLLQAQERAFLRDLRSAVDKRIENKIASARRFAVRVRNHAKMVDCYLTTYYNHKSVFGNRKQVADQIIEHPQDYHIYEGLSTLTNISRYDLPDPDVYRDFFKLNPLYDFQQLSATCTYFRGCPINRLDVAIAYDLPELVGKHRRLVESAISEANQIPVTSS